MPASKSFAIIVCLFVAITSSVAMRLPFNGGRQHSNLTQLVPAPTLSSALNDTLQWLAKNETVTGSSAGSYGAYNEHATAIAAYALWLNDTTSIKADLSYGYLASQLNGTCPMSWFWKDETAFCPGEADIPGEVLYSIASSSNLALINEAYVEHQLLLLQNSTNRGYEGYSYCSSSCTTASPVYLTVTSSVDTDMALLGLISSNMITAQNRTLAVQYLLSLQNSDGSFNLTTGKSFDQIDALGPDLASTTALTLLALKADGFTSEGAPISRALEFLRTMGRAEFGGNRHVYSAALSALAFKGYDQPDDAISAVVYILSQQNGDGGFSDSSRYSYPWSNAFDTGWAAVALETQSFEEGPPNSINSPPVTAFSFTPQAPTTGLVVHFDGSASHDPDNDPLFYKWTFGDGSRAEGLDPTHTYSSAGNFTVTLTVIDSGTNPGPLSDTKSLSIFIQPTTIQKSPGLPIVSTALWIVIGIIGLLAIIGGAFYLGRRTARNSTAYRA